MIALFIKNVLSRLADFFGRSEPDFMSVGWVEEQKKGGLGQG